MSCLPLAGHDVHDTADGRAGADMATADSFDITLIDIGLPGLDGTPDPGGQERQVNVPHRDHWIRRTADSALEAGFDAHATKPVLPERLAELFDACSQ